jgi:hypothetical protein
MKTKRFVAVLLGPALFAVWGLIIRPDAAAAGQAKPGGGADGVPVVRIPKKPAPAPGLPSTLVLKPDLVIGRESGDENYMFSELRSVQVDDQGNIYALDMKEVNVRVFDRTGRHLRTFGKKGKGPGEIDAPLRMEMTPAGQLVIEDFGSGKFVFFSLDGTCVKEIPLGKYQFLIRFKFDSQGRIYADTRTFDETKSVSEMIKFSPDFKPLATLASFEEKRVPRVIVPFSPAFALQLTSKDELVLAILQTDKYEFTVMSADGTPIRRIVKDYDPVEVAGKAKDRLVEEYKQESFPPGYTVQLPGHFPAAYYFIVDDRDRLLVRTYEYEEKPDGPWLFYDVFDAEGRYLTRLSLPEREMAFVSKKNKLYCMIQENEDGFPQVKRYDMTWK